MSRNLRYCTLICVLLWTPCEMAFKSHYGTEFFLGMIPNHHIYHPDINIDIASEAEGLVQLYVPFLNLNRTETLHKGRTSLTISKNLVKWGNFTEQRGIQIKTTAPVAIYVTSNYSSGVSSDTYMALPTAATGKTYMITSFGPISSEKSEIAIISAFHNTTLNISNHGVVNLNRLYVLQTVDDSDLSGVILSSTKPVTVISGASCSVIPVGSSDCDIIVDLMLPEVSWTDTYIVPPLPPKTGYLVRVQALDPTQVCLRNSSRMICRQIKRNSYETFVLGSEPTVINSNGSSKFSVTQYGMSQEFDNVNSGPYMTVIPGLNNFVTKYNFVVPSGYSDFNNYISVITKQSDITGLLLDGSPVHSMYNYTVSYPLDEYIVIVSSVSTGYHTLTNSDKTVEFGAFLYGLASNEGYGTPLGMKYDNERTSTTTQKQKCYRCDEMSSLEVCDAVQTCNDGEVCFGEKYTARTGTFYRSGCIDSTRCPGKNTTSSGNVCLECCHSNYCNNKGCGDHSFPDRDDRGPMCYDCQHVLNETDHCMKVTMCGPDEVCSIEKYRWGKDYHYKMGCTHHLCTPMKRSGLPERLRRSTPLCSACCSNDFCNSNCTQTTDGSTGQILVG